MAEWRAKGPADRDVGADRGLGGIGWPAEGVGVLGWKVEWEPNHIGAQSWVPALPLVPIGE